jgi:uncharacterized protein
MDNNSSSERGGMESGERRGTSAVRSRRFELEVPGGRRVHGCVDAPAGRDAQPVLICLHGFRAHADWGFFPDFAARAVGAGWCVLRLSFSGCGVLPGEDEITDRTAFAQDTYGKQLEDLEALHDALDAGAFPEADPQRWSILGHSRGSGIGLIHAAERGDARAFVGWAQITTPGSWNSKTKASWRAAGVHRVPHGRGGGHLELDTHILDDLERQARRYDLRARAAELGCPALLLHGDRDIAISAEEARTIHEALPEAQRRFVLIERTGHTFGVRHPMSRVPKAYLQLVDETLRFLGEPGR